MNYGSKMSTGERDCISKIFVYSTAFQISTFFFFFVYMVITKHSDGDAEGCNADMSGSLVYINNGSNFIRTAAELFSYPRWRSHVIWR